MRTIRYGSFLPMLILAGGVVSQEIDISDWLDPIDRDESIDQSAVSTTCQAVWEGKPARDSLSLSLSRFGVSLFVEVNEFTQVFQ